MRELVCAARMREMDQIAIQERGISSLVLMERAAHGILEAVEELAADAPPKGREKKFFLPQAQGEAILGDRSVTFVRNAPGAARRAAVFAGPGNNGGDGVAVAGLLLEQGWQVRCFLAGAREKMTPDCRAMAGRLEKLGGALEDYVPGDPDQAAWTLGADVIVDALFGVGLNSPLREPAASAVRLMNRSEAPVVSADIPSGVETDTGRILGDGVRADVTVTFSRAKPGLYVGQGAMCAGRVVVHDIGIPDDILSEEPWSTALMDGGAVRSWLPRRPADGHKGTFGKTLILGGSVGFTGAPVLAARGALRAGGGLVTVATTPEAYPIVAVKCDEAMARPIPDRWEELLAFAQGCDSVLVGPGLGRERRCDRLTLSLLEELTCPVVVDADGINALSEHMDILKERRGRVTVLTPHDGEFARLGGDLSGGDRLRAARDFARQWECVLVLKGHRTITAMPDGRCLVNPTGNSGMAKGGSGDVLGGMIVSLLGQGMDPGRAAASAAYLHGRAGDLAAAELGERSMLPGDLLDRLPRVFREVEPIQ